MNLFKRKRPKTMKAGSIIGSAIDWLAYTVDWPFEETTQTELVKHTRPKLTFSGKKQFDKKGDLITEPYEIEETVTYRRGVSRVATGYFMGKTLTIILDAILPPIITRKAKITLSEQQSKIKMKSYDCIRELHSYDPKTDTLSCIGHVGWHSRNASLGVHVVMRGEHLAVLRERGIDHRKFLGLLLALGARCSRLDIALDIKTKTKPYEIYSRVSTGDIRLGYKGKTKTWNFIEGSGGDSGAYFGSKAGEKWFRLYDKGVQMQDESRPNWLRLEAVLRDDTAQVWARAVVDVGLLPSIKSLSTYFDGWLELEHWLRNIESIEPIRVNRPESKNSDTWLYKVALKAVVDKLSDYDTPCDNFERVIREALSKRAVNLGLQAASLAMAA